MYDLITDAHSFELSTLPFKWKVMKMFTATLLQESQYMFSGISHDFYFERPKQKKRRRGEQTDEVKRDEERRVEETTRREERKWEESRGESDENSIEKATTLTFKFFLIILKYCILCLILLYENETKSKLLPLHIYECEPLPAWDYLISSLVCTFRGLVLRINE